MSEIELTEQNFEHEVTQSKMLVLVDFWAPWCGPCKRIAPIVAELAEEYNGKVKVCKVNTDEAASVAAKFQIASIPTLIIFKEGKPYEQMVGLRAKSDIKAKLDQLIS